jgi:hypothetical protein
LTGRPATNGLENIFQSHPPLFGHSTLLLPVLRIFVNFDSLHNVGWYQQCDEELLEDLFQFKNNEGRIRFFVLIDVENKLLESFQSDRIARDECFKISEHFAVMLRKGLDGLAHINNDM